MVRWTVAALAVLAAFITECRATGVLFVRPLGGTQTYQQMSIVSYDADVTIQDQIAITHVDQVCFNSSTHNVEATFVFPLPEGAIITGLVYWFNG